MNDSKNMIVNNTDANLTGMLYAEIRKAIANGGTLPEELADMFTLRKVGDNWILDWFEE